MLILFIGDILPKIYANRNPLVFSKIMVIPIYFLDRYILSLFNQPMSKSMAYLESNLTKDNEKLSVDKLSKALDLTDSNETSKEEKKILKGIVNFGNVETRQIMCPRVDVFALDSTSKHNEIIDKLISKGFSRVPVYEDNLDTIKGVLYAKDLLPHLDKSDFDWKLLLRKPLYIPENKKLDDLLTEFKTKKIHMGIVVDEEEAYEVKITDNKTAFYSVETGLKLKEVESQEVEGNLIVGETYYKNYEEVDGILFAKEINQVSPAIPIPGGITFKVDSINLNVETDESDFN